MLRAQEPDDGVYIHSITMLPFVKSLDEYRAFNLLCSRANSKADS